MDLKVLAAPNANANAKAKAKARPGKDNRPDHARHLGAMLRFAAACAMKFTPSP